MVPIKRSSRKKIILIYAYDYTQEIAKILKELSFIKDENWHLDLFPNKITLWDENKYRPLFGRADVLIIRPGDDFQTVTKWCKPKCLTIRIGHYSFWGFWPHISNEWELENWEAYTKQRIPYSTVRQVYTQAIQDIYNVDIQSDVKMIDWVVPRLTRVPLFSDPYCPLPIFMTEMTRQILKLIRRPWGDLPVLTFEGPSRFNRKVIHPDVAHHLKLKWYSEPFFYLGRMITQKQLYEWYKTNPDTNREVMEKNFQIGYPRLIRERTPVTFLAESKHLSLIMRTAWHPEDKIFIYNSDPIPESETVIESDIPVPKSETVVESNIPVPDITTSSMIPTIDNSTQTIPDPILEKSRDSESIITNPEVQTFLNNFGIIYKPFSAPSELSSLQRLIYEYKKLDPQDKLSRVVLFYNNSVYMKGKLPIQDWVAECDWSDSHVLVGRDDFGCLTGSSSALDKVEPLSKVKEIKGLTFSDLTFSTMMWQNWFVGSIKELRRVENIQPILPEVISQIGQASEVWLDLNSLFSFKNYTIPLSIHQIWYNFQNPEDSDPVIPEKYRNCMNSVQEWVKSDPQIKCKLWLGRNSLRDRILEEISKPKSIWSCDFSLTEFLEMWDNFPMEIMRCDAFRVFILYLEGGIYLDCDINKIPDRPFPDFYLYQGAFASVEFNDGVIANCILGAQKYNIFLEDVLNTMYLRRNLWKENTGLGHIEMVLKSTGPGLYHDVYYGLHPHQRGGLYLERDLGVFLPHCYALRSDQYYQNFDLPHYSITNHRFISDWVPKEILPEIHTEEDWEPEEILESLNSINGIIFESRLRKGNSRPRYRPDFWGQVVPLWRLAYYAKSPYSTLITQMARNYINVYGI